MNLRKKFVKILGSATASAVTLGIATSFVILPANAEGNSDCNPEKTYLMCEDFFGTTHFKDQNQSRDFYRFPQDIDDAADYFKIDDDNIRLQINQNATVNHYSNADISTSEINNPNGNFRFGENTRVEVRMKYGPNMKASFFEQSEAKGSAGFLFWNYFNDWIDPENKVMSTVRTSFGFTWQDNNSTLPGFWSTAVINGQFAAAAPLIHININEYHVYKIERSATSIKLFVDDVMYIDVPVNQPGAPTLSASTKLSADMWVDNTTYQQTLDTFEYFLTFNAQSSNKYIDIDYVMVTPLN